MKFGERLAADLENILILYVRVLYITNLIWSSQTQGHVYSHIHFMN
jgi:hypothetical protein